MFRIRTTRLTYHIFISTQICPSFGFYATLTHRDAAKKRPAAARATYAHQHLACEAYSSAEARYMRPSRQAPRRVDARVVCVGSRSIQAAKKALAQHDRKASAATSLSARRNSTYNMKDDTAGHAAAARRCTSELDTAVREAAAAGCNMGDNQDKSNKDPSCAAL